jgi:predicted acylesterase/phospholipase RssA
VGDVIGRAGNRRRQVAIAPATATIGAAGQEFACDRDRQLFGPGPKRVLSLDGGGVRGAVTVAFLTRIEEIFSEHYGKPVRLGDHFNLIGGTSTGAIIAGALALGYRCNEVKEFYTNLAPLVFKRQRWAIPVIHPKFAARGLRAEIEKIVGDLDMQSEKLVTGICVVTKRIDTGSPWIITNNPKAPYWEDGEGHDGNKHYKLATLVRASTAAPSFFDPEVLPISGKKKMLPSATATPLKKPLAARFAEAMLERVGWKSKAVLDPRDYGLFVDGGVTPHNNPAFALLQTISLKPFKLCWPAGPQNLTFVSVGTGSHRPRLKYEDLGFTRYAQLAIHALVSMMTDAQNLVLAQMQWLGECPAPWEINSEIGTLAGDGPPGGKLFRFMRYDIRLETDWLARELGLEVSAAELALLRAMDNPAAVERLYSIARLAAEKQVKPEHFFPATGTASGAKTATA